jgi:hypothetical protein
MLGQLLATHQPKNMATSLADIVSSLWLLEVLLCKQLLMIASSDATYHMTSHHAWFITYKPLDPRDIVYLGDNYSHHQIHGKGKVAIRLMTDDVKIIQEVYHVLALFHNVLFVKQIVTAGYIVNFPNNL